MDHDVVGEVRIGGIGISPVEDLLEHAVNEGDVGPLRAHVGGLWRSARAPVLSAQAPQAAHRPDRGERHCLDRREDAQPFEQAHHVVLDLDVREAAFGARCDDDRHQRCAPARWRYPEQAALVRTGDLESHNCERVVPNGVHDRRAAPRERRPESAERLDRVARSHRLTARTAPHVLDQLLDQVAREAVPPPRRAVPRDREPQPLRR
jgi:hypothetical protein